MTLLLVGPTHHTTTRCIRKPIIETGRIPAISGPSLRSHTRSLTSLFILKNCASNPFCPHLELVMWFSTHSVEAERRESLPRDLGETSSESTSNPSIWKSQRRESPQRQILDDSGDS